MYMNRINYNLKKISEIDKLLILNQEEKEAYINKHNYLFLMEKILKVLSNEKMIFILLIIISTILFKHNKIKTIIYSSIFILLYNSILIIIGYIFKIPKDYYDKLEEYASNRKLLLIKRNLYINLYNYSINKENSILNNIRFRINNKYFLDYDKYKNQKWLKDDLYAYATLKEMEYKEIVYTNIIRNRIELELISPYYNEDISKEKLKSILHIL